LIILEIEEKFLWQSFLEGNKQSFETIYTHYYNSLYEYGMRRVDNPEQVKDTIQDLFVKLWTNRRNLGPTDNIKYYLLTSLKRRLIDGITTAPASPEEFQMHFSVESDYLRRERHGEQAKQLVSALNQLTGRQKEIIYLRFFEELSYEQIAIIMDISVKGAYKLSYRALDALKDILNISKKDLLLLLLF
jgi:RNA polymerase sigma factor (sigma-70 family)